MSVYAKRLQCHLPVVAHVMCLPARTSAYYLYACASLRARPRTVWKRAPACTHVRSAPSHACDMLPGRRASSAETAAWQSTSLPPRRTCMWCQSASETPRQCLPSRWRRQRALWSRAC
eukprot:365684-Chlamydomonas_euryale.AAC.6